MGPVVSEAQWNKVQGLIQTASTRQPRAGGTGRPDGLDEGYFMADRVRRRHQRYDHRPGDLRPGRRSSAMTPSSRRSRLRTTLSTAWPLHLR